MLVIADFQDIFDDVLDLPTVKEVKFCIKLLPSTTPIQKVLYRMSLNEMAELKSQLDDIPNCGLFGEVILHGDSILFFTKNDESLRLSIYYRELNKHIVGNMYPLPRIDNLLDQPRRAKWFSKIDLMSGYH